MRLMEADSSLPDWGGWSAPPPIASGGRTAIQSQIKSVAHRLATWPVDAHVRGAMVDELLWADRKLSWYWSVESWCCVVLLVSCKKNWHVFWRLGVVLANGVRVVPLVGQWHSESGSVCRLLFGWLGGFAFAKWGLMVSVEWYE